MCVNVCCVPVEIRRFAVAFHPLDLVRIARDQLCSTALGAASRQLWFVLVRIAPEWEMTKWSSFIPGRPFCGECGRQDQVARGPSRKPGVLSRNGRNIRSTILHGCSPCSSKPSHFGITKADISFWKLGFLYAMSCYLSNLESSLDELHYFVFC